MERRTFRLPEDHGWKTQEGYQCLVIDRGALRIDFPQDWHVEITGPSVKISDAPPPDDECVLEVSCQRIPLLDTDRVPMGEMLEAAMQEGRLEIQERRGHNYRVAWAERKFLDPPTGKPARSRAAMVLGRNVQGLITFVFWEHDLERVGGIWESVLQSLQVSQIIPDPLSGRPIDPSAQ